MKLKEFLYKLPTYLLFVYDILYVPLDFILFKYYKTQIESYDKIVSIHYGKVSNTLAMISTILIILTILLKILTRKNVDDSTRKKYKIITIILIVVLLLISTFMKVSVLD